MTKKSELPKRPVLITVNGRPAGYLGRFAPFRLIRWLRQKIWGNPYPGG